MEQSNWDPRLDTGTGDGKAPKHGRCMDCTYKGDAMGVLRHHFETKHRFRYLGHKQVCTRTDCHCSSKVAE